jgi:hypothetical protein
LHLQCVSAKRIVVSGVFHRPSLSPVSRTGKELDEKVDLAVQRLETKGFVLQVGLELLLWHHSSLTFYLRFTRMFRENLMIEIGPRV